MARFSNNRKITYKDFHKLEGSKEHVPSMVANLETLMKTLTRYIEDKRERFPRFYFLSNEQIIEMCGVVQDINNMEKNFHKMFEGIDKIIIVYKEH